MIKTILDAVALKTATFTAAITDIITDASHGLSNGDKLVLTTDNTLPAGLSTETLYYVMAVTTDTFKLSIDKPDSNGFGVPVDITDTGTGNHTYTISSVGEAMLAVDYAHKQGSISTNGMNTNDTVTVKIQMSNQETPPDWHKAKSPSNDWQYVQSIVLADGSPVDGATGIQFADSDDVAQFAINVDGGRWFNYEITNQSDVANTTITGQMALSGKHSHV